LLHAQRLFQIGDGLVVMAEAYMGDTAFMQENAQLLRDIGSRRRLGDLLLEFCGCSRIGCQKILFIVDGPCSKAENQKKTESKADYEQAHVGIKSGNLITVFSPFV
jgi:hypothetical protein